MSKKWCQEPLIAQEAPGPTARELSGLMERWTGSWVKEWFLTSLSPQYWDGTCVLVESCPMKPGLS
jgi:hypothetical protein